MLCQMLTYNIIVVLKQPIAVIYCALSEKSIVKGNSNNYNNNIPDQCHIKLRACKPLFIQNALDLKISKTLNIKEKDATIVKE